MDEHRERFDLYISDIVLREAASGDELAAARRLTELAGIDVLTLDENARDIADVFLRRRVIPENAIDDALHVAVGTAQGMDFLLTRNCRYIAKR